MAVKTGGFLVLAQEVIFSSSVVELGIKPFGRLMTACTIATHLVLMGFVLSVTVRAFRLGFSMLRSFIMATLTVGFSVCAEKFEVSKAVVEGGFVQKNDDCVSALVFGVAGGALIGFNFSVLAVKPGFLCNIERDVLVAVKAKLFLSLFVEHLVAGRTFALEFDVCGRDFSGHDQRLNVLSGRSL